MKLNKLDSFLLNKDCPNKELILNLIEESNIESIINLTALIDRLSIHDPDGELYDAITAMMMIHFCSVQIMSDKVRIFRARRHINEDFFNDLSELTYPPPKCVNKMGRINIKNQSIYYAALNMQLAVAEVTFSEASTYPKGICTFVVSKAINFRKQRLANLYPSYMDGKITQSTFELCKQVYDNIKLYHPHFSETERHKIDYIRQYICERIRTSSKVFNYDCYKITSTIAKALFEGFAMNGIIYPTAVIGNSEACVALLPKTYDICFTPLAALRVEYEYPLYSKKKMHGNEFMNLYVTHISQLFPAPH